MLSYCCEECNTRLVGYIKELDIFYCYICENYTNARVKRWD